MGNSQCQQDQHNQNSPHSNNSSIDLMEAFVAKVVEEALQVRVTQVDSLKANGKKAKTHQIEEVNELSQRT